MRFLLPNIAGTTQPHDPNTLRERALNPGSLGIELDKVLRLLLLPPLLQSLILFLRTNADRPAYTATRTGTERARGTWLTIDDLEPTLDYLFVPLVHHPTPTHSC